MVKGKIAVQDTFAKVERAERKVKELSIPVLDETEVERQNGIAGRDQNWTAVVRSAGRILAHFRQYRTDVSSGTIDSAWSGSFGVAGRQNTYLRGRSTRRATIRISRLQHRPDWYTLDIESITELPLESVLTPSRDLCAKACFLGPAFHEIAYEVYQSMKGVVNLQATFTGEG